jgi:3-dehydroquinate synthase
MDPGNPASTILQAVEVRFDYPVVFTRGAFEPGNPALADALARKEPARRHRFFAVLDAGVAAAWPRLAADVAAYAAHHAARLELAAPVEVVPGGERAKDGDAVARALWARFAALGLDRHSFVVGIGGGAMLDAVGYAAATCHRGLRMVRLPTTVLAQNDAGIGVKNGINLQGAKNFVGTFAPPFAVINDLALLATLHPRDRAAGMAEAVKVALIRDAAFFRWLADHAGALAAFDSDAVATMIRRAAELHLAHIAGGGDPFELGTARPLDFGHWAAHKLELLTAHALRHGEAVAIGMALDSRYSVEAGLLAAADCAAIVGLLRRLGLPVWDDALARRGPDGRPAVLAGLAEFREHLGGELSITLLAGIGRGVDATAIDEARVLRAIDWLAETRNAA